MCALACGLVEFVSSHSPPISIVPQNESDLEPQATTRRHRTDCDFVGCTVYTMQVLGTSHNIASQPRAASMAMPLCIFGYGRLRCHLLRLVVIGSSASTAGNLASAASCVMGHLSCEGASNIPYSYPIEDNSLRDLQDFTKLIRRKCPLPLLALRSGTETITRGHCVLADRIGALKHSNTRPQST